MGPMRDLVDAPKQWDWLARANFELRLRTLDLNATLRQVVDAARPAAERHGHVIDFHRAPSPVTIRGDAARLAQI